MLAQWSNYLEVFRAKQCTDMVSTEDEFIMGVYVPQNAILVAFKLAIK